MKNVPIAIFCVLTLTAAGLSCSRSAPSQDPAGAPSPVALTRILGVQVDAAPGEVNQYLIRSAPGSVDFSKIGRIHQDLGYAVGVTLFNGVQIGFRYEPTPSGSAPATPGSSSAESKN